MKGVPHTDTDDMQTINRVKSSIRLPPQMAHEMAELCVVEDNPPYHKSIRSVRKPAMEWIVDSCDGVDGNSPAKKDAAHLIQKFINEPHQPQERLA